MSSVCYQDNIWPIHVCERNVQTKQNNAADLMFRLNLIKMQSSSLDRLKPGENILLTFIDAHLQNNIYSALQI